MAIGLSRQLYDVSFKMFAFHKTHEGYSYRLHNNLQLTCSTFKKKLRYWLAFGLVESYKSSESYLQNSLKKMKKMYKIQEGLKLYN